MDGFEVRSDGSRGEERWFNQTTTRKRGLPFPAYAAWPHRTFCAATTSLLAFQGPVSLSSSTGLLTSTGSTGLIPGFSIRPSC